MDVTIADNGSAAMWQRYQGRMMIQLSQKEISEVCGGNPVYRAVVNWFVGSMAWEAVLGGFGAISPRSSSGGQMNQGRRSNMYN